MAVEIDSTPPKLVKLAAIPLNKPLTETINFCMQHNIFPDSAKGLPLTKENKTKRKFQILDYRHIKVFIAPCISLQERVYYSACYH